MTKQTLPQYVIDNLSLCIPPSEDYTGMVITDKGIFTFINGRPSQPFGQWGCYVYSTYYAEEEQPPMNEQIRADFEEWHLTEHGFRSVWHKNAEVYDHDEVQERWVTWQAAHARYAGSESEAEPFGYLIYDHNENTEDFTRIKPESINREHEEIVAVYLRPPAPAVPDVMRIIIGMVEYAECNDPGNPYLAEAKAMITQATKESDK